MLDLGGKEPDVGGRKVEWCRAVQPPTAGEEPFELRDVRWGYGLGGGDREPELCAERSRPTTTALIAHRARHLDEVGRPPHVRDAVPASRGRDGGQPVRVEREEPDPAPSVRPPHIGPDVPLREPRDPGKYGQAWCSHGKPERDEPDP